MQSCHCAVDVTAASTRSTIMAWGEVVEAGSLINLIRASASSDSSTAGALASAGSPVCAPQFVVGTVQPMIAASWIMAVGRMPSRLCGMAVMLTPAQISVTLVASLNSERPATNAKRDVLAAVIWPYT